MNDYSDLLFLIGAIAIYSLLVGNITHTMLQNNELLTTSEMEYGAISVAQNIVEKARWMKYGETTEAKLKAANNNPLYDVNVAISDTTIPASDNINKKIDISVSSLYMNDNKQTVTMRYIKANR